MPPVRMCAPRSTSELTLAPGERALVPTGLSIALPPGFEAQIRPRSGLALRDGVTCLNTPGTIDADYRGPIGVILANLGSLPVTIRRGDRIAQLVVAPVSRAQFELVDELPESMRGVGGFGSTGMRSVKVYIVGRGAVGSYLGDRLASIGVDVAYAPRALDAVTAVRRRRGNCRDQGLRHRRRHRDAAQGDCVSGKVRLRIAAKRRRERRETCRRLRREQRRRRCAHGAGRSSIATGMRVPPRRAEALPFRRSARALTTGWSRLSRAAVCGCSVVEDWRALKWSKLALNVVANASCAILNVLPARMVHFEKIYTLEIRMIREVRAVMSAMKLHADRFAALSGARAARLGGTAQSRSRARVMARRSPAAAARKPPSLLARFARRQDRIPKSIGSMARSRRRDTPTACRRR